jgi:hypothetical protein
MKGKMMSPVPTNERKGKAFYQSVLVKGRKDDESSSDETAFVNEVAEPQRTSA